MIVFGNARVGTPLMEDDPRIGIELPLRVLVWRRGDGVHLAYRDPRAFAGEFDVAAHAATLEQMATLLDQLVKEASG